MPDIMDSISKALTILFIAVGSGIMVLIVMVKMDVLAKRAEAEVKEVAAQMDWESQLYYRTIREVRKNKEGP